MLASMIQKFNMEAQKHKERQSLNPFSGSFSRSPSPRLSNDEYGKPIAGSKTEERGKKAKCHVLKEVLELCNCIYDVATSNAQASKQHEDDQDDEIIVTFKEIFQIYTNINDKVVGLLIAAKKRGFIYFEKEILFQRQDDDVLIALIKPISEIRAIINKEIYPQTSTASTKLPKEQVNTESNSDCNEELDPRAETDNGNENLPQLSISDVISDGENENSLDKPEFSGNEVIEISPDQQLDQHHSETVTIDDSQVSENDPQESESLVANDIKYGSEKDLCSDGLEKGFNLDEDQEIIQVVNESVREEGEIRSELLHEFEAQNLTDAPVHVESSYPHETVINVQVSNENEKPEIINSDFIETPKERTNSLNNYFEPLNSNGAIPLVTEDNNQTLESKITQIEVVLNEKDDTESNTDLNGFEYEQDTAILNQVSIESSQEEKCSQYEDSVEESQNVTIEDGAHAQINHTGSPDQNQQPAPDVNQEITSSDVCISDSIPAHVGSTNVSDRPENPSSECLEIEVSHENTDITATGDDLLLTGEEPLSSQLEVCHSCESITEIEEPNAHQIDACLEIIHEPLERSTTPDNCDKEVESILEPKLVC